MNLVKLLSISFCSLVALHVACAAEPATEWHSYGQDPGGARYSSLDQINCSNVTQLERAWTYRTGDIAEKGHYAECTPLVIDGVVYVITPFSRLIAIDALSGEELWRFSPDPPLNLNERAAGYGAPVTYLGKDGHQYVVLFAGGGGKAGSPKGDYVVAYRLKR